MPKRRDLLAIAGVGALAAGMGVLFGPGLGRPDQAGAKALDAARFTDLEGKPRGLEEWRTRVLVINFWATWCAPCREEIPGFMAIRDKLHASGVEFVGIAIDQAAKVATFSKELRISYPILVADAGGLDLIRLLGNPGGGLPFTLVRSREGVIAGRHLGLLKPDAVEEMLRPLVA